MSEILMVDDNHDNLDLLGKLLRARSHKVRAATSGRRAIDSARLMLPDLVLLDITMPDMNGYETCEVFKADPVLARIPIIFISALDDPLDKVKAFTVGGADYITKPFQAEEVMARVDHQLRISALTQDLLERNRRLEEAYAQLQILNEQKNHFLGIVAHDLRNPLNSIVLASQLLEGEDDLSQIAEIAQKITHEGMDMSALIGRFLEVAAMESGELRAEITTLSLQDWVALMAERHLPQAKKKQIELKLELIEGNVQVQGDQRFMKEVLDNLVSNALKFSPRHTTITLRLVVEGGEAVVSIEDQGPGLTAEDRQRLFGRFARLSAQPTGGEKSTGLGLSIVKYMVDAMQGRVWVDSEPGMGAAFRVALPLAHPSQQSASTQGLQPCALS